MRAAYSELILLGRPVTENVRALMEAGSNQIELMMDAGAWDSFHGQYARLAEELRGLGAEYSVHPAAWDINLTAEMEILRDAAYRHHLEALEFSARLGASQMVVHPGFAYSPCFDKGTAKKRAHEAVCRLAEEAGKAGVKLAFENVGYNGASIYTEEEFLAALDGVDPVAGYLIDIGHANVNRWDIPGMIEKLSGRLFGLHIHDNNGSCDAHLPIGEGTVDWEAVFAAMEKIRTPGCEYILEYAPGLPLEKLKRDGALLEKKLN